MQPFTVHTGLAVPLDRSDIDTDAIIPKQFLKSVKRTGFGKNLFNDWRYVEGDESRPNPDFVLNRPRYRGGSVLVTGGNFGCGSSREHAPWALADYGFRAVVAPSFADIFYSNALKNGLLPAPVDAEGAAKLMREIEATEGCEVTVDLEKQEVRSPGGLVLPFEIGAHARHCLLNGLDDIGLTLQHESEIAAFEQRDQAQRAWLWRQQ